VLAAFNLMNLNQRLQNYLASVQFAQDRLALDAHWKSSSVRHTDKFAAQGASAQRGDTVVRINGAYQRLKQPRRYGSYVQLDGASTRKPTPPCHRLLVQQMA
jgi:hypothetical protein